jgi:hypothetical protein
MCLYTQAHQHNADSTSKHERKDVGHPDKLKTPSDSIHRAYYFKEETA